MTISNRLRLSDALAVPLLCLSTSAWCAETSLADLSLEDLMKIEVTSASKRPQRLDETPAAAFVITAEDIRRSGVTSIPEALRMAPGVEVAKIASNKWAITVRGFNGRFANKLLVLMDGRSVYSPLWSGTLWENQDTMIEDIERIEVIRGPGAAVWGANAVNGVINIITRHAKDTQGVLAVAGMGAEEKAFAAGRVGSTLGTETFVRGYAKAYERDAGVEPGGLKGPDTWRGGRAGFRLDSRPSAERRLTLIGEAFDSKSGDTWNKPQFTPPYTQRSQFKQANSGWNLTARYEGFGESGSEWMLQSYLDSYHLGTDGTFSENRDTFDVEFHHRSTLAKDHDLLWGLGYRGSRDRIETSGVASIDPGTRPLSLFSGFLNDDIQLIRDKLRLTLGTRIEHNEWSGWSNQPTARLAWQLDRRQMLWSSLSRAVRTPSRGELDLSFDTDAAAPAPPLVPLATVTRVNPSRNATFGPEKVETFEIGYRNLFTSALTLDLTAFASHYRDLRAARLATPFLEPSPLPPHLVIPLLTENRQSARTTGIEAAVDWHPLSWLRVQPSYTYLRLSVPASTDPALAGSREGLEGSDPRHQLSLRTMMDLGRMTKLDLWLRSVSGLPAQNVPHYTALDLRYAWQATRRLELALVAQNLGRHRQLEFISDNLGSVPVQIQRSVFLTARFGF